ncbi:MAG TPA: sulfite exporter TauE/SafE family protein [Woeseiaceae bacterium]
MLLALSGFVAWIVSTIAGGGGAMLLVPLTGFIAGAQAVAPVVTLASLIGDGGRLLVFRRSVDWTVVGWGIPGAIVGALLGAVSFAHAPADWLQVLSGLVMIWHQRATLAALF